MSIILLNAPSVSIPKELGVFGKMSYADCLKHYLLGSEDNYSSMPLEHLGFGYIQSYAKAIYNIDIYSINAIIEGHKSTEETLNKVVEVCEISGPPKLVGVSIWHSTYYESLFLIDEIKKIWPNCMVVLGHDFASLNYNELLLRCTNIDAVLLGEGERSFSLLSKMVLDGCVNFSQIEGIAFFDNNNIICNPIINPLNIDKLPWPKRFDIEKAMSLGFSAAIHTARGCPYNCIYCTTSSVSRKIYNKERYRYRSPSLIAKEIEHIIKKYGVNYYVIVDDSFIVNSSLSRNRAIEFSKELYKRHIKTPFMIDARIDAIDKQTFKHLYDVGLTKVYIGIESTVEEQLIFYQKGHTLAIEEVQKKIDILKDIGIEIVLGILMFHPDSSFEELEENAKIIKYVGTKQYSQYTNAIIPYPGTDLYEKYCELGYITNDWPSAKWKFKNPIVGEFYDTIMEYVKKTLILSRILWNILIQNWNYLNKNK